MVAATSSPMYKRYRRSLRKCSKCNCVMIDPRISWRVRWKNGWSLFLLMKDPVLTCIRVHPSELRHSPNFSLLDLEEVHMQERGHMQNGKVYLSKNTVHFPMFIDFIWQFLLFVFCKGLQIINRLSKCIFLMVISRIVLPFHDVTKNLPLSLLKKKWKLLNQNLQP